VAFTSQNNRTDAAVAELNKKIEEQPDYVATPQELTGNDDLPKQGLIRRIFG